MARTISPAKIDRMVTDLTERWRSIQYYLRLIKELDVIAFLKENPKLTGILAILKMEGGEWNIESFIPRLVQEAMPDILDAGDEFILSCYVAFERFPKVISGQINGEIPEVDKTVPLKETDDDPVKIFKGKKNLKEFLEACGNDPHKVLGLFDQGAKQCGSARQFSEAIGISNGYFYANRKRLQAMIPVGKGIQAESREVKTKKSKTAKTAKTDKKKVGAFADLQAKATTPGIIDMLGHGKAAKFRAFFEALGGTEEKVRLAIEKAYDDDRRPADAVAYLVAKYSLADFDQITLRRFSRVFGFHKNFRGSGKAKKNSVKTTEDDGIAGELAEKLTAGRLDEAQVAGLTTLAEEYSADSIAGLLKKISKDGTDSTGAAKILAEHEVLPVTANHIAFMRFKTEIGS